MSKVISSRRQFAIPHDLTWIGNNRGACAHAFYININLTVSCVFSYIINISNGVQLIETQ